MEKYTFFTMDFPTRKRLLLCFKRSQKGGFGFLQKWVPTSSRDGDGTSVQLQSSVSPGQMESSQAVQLGARVPF